MRPFLHAGRMAEACLPWLPAPGHNLLCLTRAALSAACAALDAMLLAHRRTLAKCAILCIHPAAVPSRATSRPHCGGQLHVLVGRLPHL